MKKNKLLIALSIAACSGAAIANDKIDYSFSLKKIIGSTTGSGSIFNIPYFGLNGFSSIDEKSFLYGTFTRSPKVSASATITRSGTITFTNYEGGYGYLWDKSTQLTVGYRSQTISNVNPSATLAGVIFGANFSF